MQEPVFGKGSQRLFIRNGLFQYLVFGAMMSKQIEEVINQHYQFLMLPGINLAQCIIPLFDGEYLNIFTLLQFVTKILNMSFQKLMFVAVTAVIQIR